MRFQKHTYKRENHGRDTQDLMCYDCKHIGWWKDFQPKEQEENIGKED